MKILLLGGNGYVGSKVYPLLKEKYVIDSVDLCLYGLNLGYSNKLNYATVGISEYDVIVCLAGHSSVKMSESDSQRSWTNNVEYFRQLCDRLSQHQLLIYASSGSVYGSGGPPATEEMPINFDPINNYDLQKMTIDLIAARHIKLGKKIVGLRFGTVNGPAPNTRGELMLNSMVKSALDSGLVRIKNLHLRRSILGINDVSRAIVGAIECPPVSGFFNLSSFTSTVREMGLLVADKLKAKIDILENDKTYYDYEINSDKFISAINFRFLETAETIIDDLVKQHHSVVYDTRDFDHTISIFEK